MIYHLYDSLLEPRFGNNLSVSMQSMIGHCLGAAGGLEAIATIKAITTGWVHPTINQFVSTQPPIHQNIVTSKHPSCDACANLKCEQTTTMNNSDVSRPQNPDPAVEQFDTVRAVKQRHQVHVGISNSFGFGGQNSVVVFAPFRR